MIKKCLSFAFLTLLAASCCVQPCQRTYIFAQEMIKEKIEISTCALDHSSNDHSDQ